MSDVQPEAPMSEPLPARQPGTHWPASPPSNDSRDGLAHDLARVIRERDEAQAQLAMAREAISDLRDHVSDARYSRASEDRYRDALEAIAERERPDSAKIARDALEAP